MLQSDDKSGARRTDRTAVIVVERGIWCAPALHMDDARHDASFSIRIRHRMIQHAVPALAYRIRLCRFPGRRCAPEAEKTPGG
jgi:hypothetical protein